MAPLLIRDFSLRRFQFRIFRFLEESRWAVPEKQCAENHSAI